MRPTSLETFILAIELGLSGCTEAAMPPGTTDGTRPVAGSSGTGGTKTGGGAIAGNAAGGGCTIDQGGVPLAKPGDQTSASRGYLNLGDLRLLNNRWGSDERGCSSTTMRVFANTDGSVGWDFNRGACGGAAEQPDYPEIEFGINPFGTNSTLRTSPAFSSTPLMPIQIKNLTSASVTVDDMRIALGTSAKSWNLDFELWLSQNNPVTSADPGVYAELITFWGWQAGRWPCDTALNATVTAGTSSYRLCHQSNTWADGQWRYFQFWVNGGPYTSYTGKVDAKALLDWLVSAYGYSRELWVTRFEIGSEIDDDTNGTVTLRNVTFEVNGTSRSIELCR